MAIRKHWTRNRLRQHGITDEVLTAKLAAGLRWCSGHQDFVPSENFRAIQCFAFCRLCERNRELLRKFGITDEWYEEQFARQGGVCAICGVPPSPNKRLDIDHNHETGQVRGLLCKRCNSALERVEKVLNWVSRALAYLRHYSVLAEQEKQAMFYVKGIGGYVHNPTDSPKFCPHREAPPKILGWDLEGAVNFDSRELAEAFLRDFSAKFPGNSYRLRVVEEAADGTEIVDRFKDACAFVLRSERWTVLPATNDLSVQFVFERGADAVVLTINKPDGDWDIRFPSGLLQAISKGTLEDLEKFLADLSRLNPVESSATA